jgi:GDP/UDP-N,N'-diacetylbacillosamine 2-epimerase (hydrolysing)
MKNNKKIDKSTQKNKKILIITGSRAEYGILKHLIMEMRRKKNFNSILLATGMHMLKKYGLTVEEITGDGIKVDYKVRLSKMNSSASTGVADSIAECISKLSKIYDSINPDLILILGDRFEIFAAATAALIKKIPIAHIHGGELTQGAYDDSLRHSITKMSHVHFVSHLNYKKRVIQLGEDPASVYVVGALGVEGILKTKLLNKNQLEKQLNLKFLKKSLLITYHPETLEKMSASIQMGYILDALKNLADTTLIFTLPNADTDSDEIVRAIKKFQAKNNNAHIYTSLGQIKYLSCMQYVDGVIGNSSSGIIEAPSFKIGTINIGERQSGRVQAKSIINCGFNVSEINSAIKKLYSVGFKKIISKVDNPYVQKNTVKNIIKILDTINIDNLVKKRFYDLEG